jgi:hypothetical protein
MRKRGTLILHCRCRAFDANMAPKIKDTQVVELIGRNRLGSEILHDGLDVAVVGCKNIVGQHHSNESMVCEGCVIFHIETNDLPCLR